MWLLTSLSYVPILPLFKAASRLVRFEYRYEGGRRWHLAATAYDVIDWDDFDDGDPILSEPALWSVLATKWPWPEAAS